MDHFGFTHIVNDNDLSAPTHRLANETTSFNLRHPRGCNASTCLRAGFLPFDRVPRVGSWLEHPSTAVVHHIVEDGSPSAHRARSLSVGTASRLDGYDEVDFDDYERALKSVSTASIDLWLVDENLQYDTAKLVAARAHRSRAGSWVDHWPSASGRAAGRAMLLAACRSAAQGGA